MSGQQPARGDASQVFQPLAADDPTTIAGYRLAAKLGAGGMGKVYLSYTPGGRPVAIKVIRPEFGEDAEFRRRFAQEVQSAQRVQGLFTAPVIDADTEGAQPWLATAYVPGPSLADAVVAHGALPVETVLLMIAGMAEALHVIHGAGIVHRDLKPSNVLLAADGPRVIDFGIAYAADATSLTGSGVTIGTPSFMAPEQAAGRRVTPATDIFALGQVAAFASTGSPAFGEGTSHGVLYRIVHEEPDLTGVPERLMELVGRCLAKDAADRPSVAEVIRLCQTANAETVLRRPEDWLPKPVAADITVRAAAPAPVQTPPPPPSAPAAAPTPAPTPTPAAPATPPAQAPAAPATPAAPPVQDAPPAPAAPVAYSPTAPAPSTPPPGYGPPVTPAPGHGPAPVAPGPYGAQGGYQQAQPSYGYPGPAYTGGGVTQPTAQVAQPAPPKRRRGRAAALAIVAALLFGVAGGGTAYFLLKDDGKEDKAGAVTQDKNEPKPTKSSRPSSDDTAGTDSGAGTEDDGETRQPDGQTPATTDPTPDDFPGINLTRGYHLTFGDAEVRPQDGVDGEYELAYDSGYLEAESDGGKLTLLDPGQEGSLDVCRAETRFASSISIEKLSKGRQVCVTTGTGHMGLVTFQAKSPEDSPSDYITLDVTVWRNAVR
ncbi:MULTISPECIES: serine/threonine-protein kinase [unclassified Streptomyces]|uniref:serine/threonine-protein kinase n=1 Tax=unclassified Streptomyces TaxID=2593676 RepID=UPI000DACE682|nr:MULTISPECIES: serine/threonine-protein kinase [unclassified Streptomyces]PZT71958.1 serine/threonine protein kinase [Streptomyces sp. AC1-42T]PZT81717.1 serine/threonine protein kinase [Streptomyces sp. AC1-42W]